MSLLSRRLAWAKHVKATVGGTVGGSVGGSVDGTVGGTAAVDLRVHLVSTFTIDPLAPYLGEALLGTFSPAVTVGGFDQIVQGFHGSDDDMSRADVVVVWPRFEDLWRGDWPLLAGDGDHTVERLRELADLAMERTAQRGQTLVFVLPALPQAPPLGVGDAGNRFGVGAVSASSRELLRERLTEGPGVLVSDAEDIVRALGITGAFDNRRMAAATIPYTEEAFALAGDRLARLVLLSRKGSRKVVVVDADNTLWGGVVGEDGADGIDLADQGPGVSYREFQQYLLALRRAGMLVALASKNNEADAFEALARPEMVLTPQHLAAWRVDWNAKSANIAAMADELNLATSSMVFIDDSPMERAEVESALADVAVLVMPEDPAGWWSAVAASGALDRLAPTASDLGRAASYATETERRVARAAVSPEEFLAGLELVVSVITPGPADVPRFAQLIAKTNQFTLGGERHVEASLVALLQGGAVGRLFAARDRFGDYGVIGAFLLRGAPSAGASDSPSDAPGGSLPPAARIDSFVLSCRAMSRGIEDAMLAEAYSLGARTVTVFETGRNLPARGWLSALGVDAYGVAVPFDRSGRGPQWPAHLRRDDDRAASD